MTSKISEAFTRRAFLAGAGAVVLTAACGKESGSSSKPDDEREGAGAGAQDLIGIIASADLYMGATNRFAFGVVRGDSLVRGGDVRVGFAPDGTKPRALSSATFHGDGLPEDKGVFVATADFDQPGIWQAVVELEGKRATLNFQVSAQPKVPAPGGAAPRAAAPTVTDTLGVDPICTRVPACPLHTVALDTAIGGGEPVAVMFSTPARCTSRVCGPVLELLLGMAPSYEGRIAFSHVEIFNSAESTDLVPTLGAWGLETEPWLFGIKGDGTIAARLDGAFDAPEVKALLDSLVV